MSMKRAVRLEVNQRLKTLSKDYIDQQSALVFSQLCSLPQFAASTGFSVYLSMGGEVNTESFLNKGFEHRQRVFIPKILGKKSADMFMLEVPDMKTIQGFAKNSWGIPEPPMEIISASQDGTYNGAIDLVLLPGVAFDRNCNRLGHGKGYYGKSPACCIIPLLLY
jgi:5-formyltetrahydrofolate cyclo-ligase